MFEKDAIISFDSIAENVFGESGLHSMCRRRVERTGPCPLPEEACVPRWPPDVERSAADCDRRVECFVITTSVTSLCSDGVEPPVGSAFSERDILLACGVVSIAAAHSLECNHARGINS